MKCGTSVGPDGLVLEFFEEYCPLIGYDYLVIIFQVVGVGMSRVMRGLIALLHKGGECAKMTNWCPITLNTSFLLKPYN